MSKVSDAGNFRRCLQVGIALLLMISSLSAAEHHGQVFFNGLGVPGAVVTASSGDQKFNAVTDLRGFYQFSDLADGIWIIRVEMQAFAPIQQEVTTGSSEAARWEMKLLPIDQIQGIQAAPPPISAPVIAEASSNKKANSKKGDSPAPTNTKTPFQKVDVNASSSASLEVSAETKDLGDLEELNQRAADGLVISGSANNGASSGFAQNRAFGNLRNLIGSPYNGSINLNLNNSALDARPYSLSGINTPRRGYNRWGGGLGLSGPLRIPKIISDGPRFYVFYNFSRNRNAQTLTGLVPTLAERAGDLSQALGQIFDPVNNLPFANNQIPDDRISPQARALLKLFPQPNFTGNSQYNYQVATAGSSRSDGISSMMTRAIGKNNQLTGNFSLNRSRGDNTNLMGFLDSSRSQGTSATLNWRRSFTQRLSITFYYQFSRQSSESIPFFSHRENISGLAGISGNNQEPVNWGPPALSFSSGLSGLYDASPSANHDQTHQINVSGYWNRGEHGVSFGAGYSRRQDNRLEQANPRGAFQFNGAATSGLLIGIPLPGARNDFAGFLLGIPDTVSIAFGNADKYFRSSSYNASVEDDWRLSRSFTLKLGLRWEYWTPVTELYGRLVNLDLTSGYSAAQPVIANQPVGSLTGRKYPSSLLRADKAALQPRIGAAWKPIMDASLVLRAGYGIYYNSSPYESIAELMAQQSPLSKSLSVQNTPAAPLTLAGGFNASPNTTTNTFAVDPNLRIGYVHTWQFSLQFDLPGAFQFSAIYQGSRGRHGLQEILPNSYPTGSVNPCPSCPSGFRYLTSNGSSNRNAGTFQLRRRLHNGFETTLQYTFSKSIDDAAPGASGAAGAFTAQDWRNPGAERALSSFDQRHKGEISFRYTTGMGSKGGIFSKGWKGGLYKEWNITTEIGAGSGLPQTPVYSYTIAGTGVTGPMRPDLTGESVYAAPAGLRLNPAAYKAPAPGHWGAAGRNSIIGPSQFTMNASLGRSFKTSDRTTLNLNINVNNLLNHVTFRSWNATLGSSQFGLPSAPGAMRSVNTTLRWTF